MRFRFAPEGWLFIVPFVILAALALLVQWYIAAILCSAVAAFLLNFFRAPHRRAAAQRPPGDGDTGVT